MLKFKIRYISTVKDIPEYDIYLPDYFGMMNQSFRGKWNLIKIEGSSIPNYRPPTCQVSETRTCSGEPLAGRLRLNILLPGILHLSNVAITPTRKGARLEFRLFAIFEPRLTFSGRLKQYHLPGQRNPNLFG